MAKLTVAGVELDNNTAETKQRRSCGWSGATTITQQRSERWTKRRQNLRIFGISRKRGEFTATLWLERHFNNDTGVRNRRKNCLEMFVRMEYDDVLTLNWRWAACGIKNVGITTCRRQ
jgi:hypothetical protein